MSATARVQELRARSAAIQQKTAAKNASSSSSSTGYTQVTVQQKNYNSVPNRDVVYTTSKNGMSYTGQYSKMSNEDLCKTINNLKKTITTTSNQTAVYYAQKALEGYQLEIDHRKTSTQANYNAISSGKSYTIDDIMSLNGKKVNVINDGYTESAHDVVINIDRNLAETVMLVSNELKIDPTLIIAVMAHESSFDPNASSGAATGIMQIGNNWFSKNIGEDDEQLIEMLGGNPEDIKNSIANVVSWGNAYQCWLNKYGYSEESLRALRQGSKEYNENNIDGWSVKAHANGQEFLAIKNSIDKYIN